MDESHMRLDGNAAAGLLDDVLAGDITLARARCGACGSAAEVGAQVLYMYPGAPGAVLRCHRCEAVLMVMVRVPGRLRIGLPGVTWLDIPEPAPPDL